MSRASPVLEAVPGQEAAIGFLLHAASRPHHAYVFAGPEGGGKQLAMSAFAAALLCTEGTGCGTCRACTLALAGRHPNIFSVEPEGMDIRVDTIRSEVWHPAYRTAPEPGRKLFVIREADRLSPSAADALLKVLEEPPADTVLLLSSARPDELPETILSRCHVVNFQPLTEAFVVQALVDDGIATDQAVIAARLTGGNLGRARRMALDSDGLDFREVARDVLSAAQSGVRGAIDAATRVTDEAKDYKKGLAADLDREMQPFQDADGRLEEEYSGLATRLRDRHKRRERRAERDYIDRVLLAASALLRDSVLVSVGGDPDWRMHLDVPAAAGDPVRPARAIAALEEARAALADETNLNARLVLEHAFLEVAQTFADDR